MPALESCLGVAPLRYAQLETDHGFQCGTRVTSLVQVRDAGNLLTRAGLTIPAVDVDELVVRYGTPMELIAHLRVRAAWLLLLNILQTTPSSSAACRIRQAAHV